MGYLQGRLIPPLKQAAINCPDDVDSSLSRAFWSCHWDWAENKPKSSGKVTVDSLVKALESLNKQFPRPHMTHSATEPAAKKVDVKPTQAEVSDYKKACSRLWELDIGRLEQVNPELTSLKSLLCTG